MFVPAVGLDDVSKSTKKRHGFFKGRQTFFFVFVLKWHPLKWSEDSRHHINHFTRINVNPKAHSKWFERISHWRTRRTVMYRQCRWLEQKEQREGNELTQGISLAILVRDGEHTHHLVPLLPQVAVHLLAEQALANDCQFELILVVALSRDQTQTH